MNLIMYGTGISYHYRLFINITFGHVNSLARANARKLLSRELIFG
jgi:hypothetical protein